MSFALAEAFRGARGAPAAEPPAPNPVDRSFRAAGLHALAAIVELAGVALFLEGRSGAPSAAGSDRGLRDDFSSLADRIARIEDEVIVRRLLSAGIEVLRWNLARGLDSLRVREKGARV